MNNSNHTNPNYLRWILQVVIGCLFVFSAYSKLIMPGIVEIILVDHGLFKDRTTAAYFVRFLIAGELAVGLMFFQKHFLKKIVIPVSLLFLGTFTIYLVYTGFILGDTQNCGCFGELIKMSPLESIIKNIFLIALIIVLHKNSQNEKGSYFLPLIVLTISVATALVFAPIKDLKDFRFKSYSYFEGKGRVDLSSGEKIIAVFDLGCEDCQKTAKKIADLEKSGKELPEIYALFFQEGKISQTMFDEITGSHFPYTMISAKEFFDLIGNSPPRLYLLKDGKIKEYWDKNFVHHLIAILKQMK